MMLLSLALAIQAPDAVRAPLEAYGAQGEWDVRIGRAGVLYRTADPLSGLTARYFPPARVRQEGARTIFTTRTAEGQPVVITIEPGTCRTGAHNQTALRAQLSIEGRSSTGCAEDGIEDEVPATPALVGDYFLDDGIRATGTDGDWFLAIGGLGATYLMRGDSQLRGEGPSPQPRVERQVATYRFSTEEQEPVTATVQIGPCSLTSGEAYPFTVEVRTGGATLSGCGRQGNLPPPLITMSDGGSGPEFRSGEIDNDRDYPPAASAAGASGAVTVRYMVGADGRVTSCEVSESAGNADLDSATCRLIQERYRFEPARDRSGRPGEASLLSRVVWRLPSG